MKQILIVIITLILVSSCITYQQPITNNYYPLIGKAIKHSAKFFNIKKKSNGYDSLRGYGKRAAVFNKKPKGFFFKTKSGIWIFSVMGSVGFTSFVLEEAEQTCMFGNFALSKPPQYSKKPVRDEFSNMSIAALTACFKIHDTATLFNNTIGYIYPFGFAYRTYQEADELYLCSQMYKSLKSLKQGFEHAGDLGQRCISLYQKN